MLTWSRGSDHIALGRREVIRGQEIGLPLEEGWTKDSRDHGLLRVNGQ